MCLFKAPKAPEIVYQGPSAEDVAASNQALQDFQDTTAANTAAFQTSINEQITAAQASTQTLMDQLADTQANSGAGVENIINDAPYAVVTEDNVTPEDAQTTAAITKKKKKPSTLKIATGGLSASAGTGVNYGV
tara:strand:- start:919 stop:1320 length:402 start_codon:yes stop_codon:yes gene_type:complete